MLPTLCRYPGGKTKLARPILQHLTANPLLEFREPFFGGGSIGLRMMTTTNANCWINDRDPTVYALWQAVAHRTDDLKEAIRQFTPSVAEFRRIKSQFLNLSAPLTWDLALVARDKLALQSMSFSGLGVMSHGPVGGWSQDNQTVASRWSPESICKRIDVIAPKLAHARITNLDFAALLDDDRRATVYLDPPYFCAGPQLYQHSFTEFEHLRLAKLLRHSNHDWLLSYDDCKKVREMYDFARIDEVEVTYSVSKSRRTRELLISPRSFSRSALALAA